MERVTTGVPDFAEIPRVVRHVLPVSYPAAVNLHRLLGEAAWQRLPLAVRARFDDRHAEREYQGSFEIVRASLMGKLLAFICRLCNTPVAPFTGRHVPATVNVFPTADGGTAWQRIYQFAGHAPSVVESVKRLDRDGGLIEALPAGLRMRLQVFEREQVLHFLSCGYYFEIGTLRIALPDWLPPGITHVEHIDLGAGWFRFTMTVTHAWLGEVFYQTGCFHAAGDTQ